ncbi:hypothetical protein Cob_v008919 [Colletotrichum orbiculare MAFF 240422]|uniref:Uncharacterized protein n=1 Tax=Colletotrichum orbiculare (strain 104-T / ATCC 96160 / CBS 514.97 / LARS 414 / MAFF 240422) TaxID=1213857 RepID=A0A484FK80_COLOR|nr:hypothetical protein Cob_v008919 [Colletotrichum orbiculare MAFF 240422]
MDESTEMSEWSFRVETHHCGGAITVSVGNILAVRWRWLCAGSGGITRCHCRQTQASGQRFIDVIPAGDQNRRYVRVGIARADAWRERRSIERSCSAAIIEFSNGARRAYVTLQGHPEARARG